MLFAQSNFHTVWLNNQQKACTEAEAFYKLNYSYTDSKEFIIKQYYKSGPLYMEGKCFRLDTLEGKNMIYSGLCTWYHKNGQKSIVKTFDNNGLENGQCTWYHPDGKEWKSINYIKGQPGSSYTERDQNGDMVSIFEENFESNQNVWDLYSSDMGSAQMKDGYLILESKNPNGIARYIPLHLKSKSYSIELICKPSDANPSLMCGLLYNFKDWNNYNYFLLKGNYLFLGGKFEGIDVKDADGLFYGDVKKGFNSLKLISNGEKNIYSINGDVVYSTTSRPQEGNLGVLTGSGGEFISDKLLVKEFEQKYSSDDKDVKQTGTGFLVSGNGIVATNYHVIEGADKIEIVFPENPQKAYRMDLLISDKETDLALLKIIDTTFRSVGKLKYKIRQGQMELGSSVFTLGYPLPYSGLGTEIKFSDGKISSKTGFGGSVRMYQTSVPVQGGNSGSPLFDKEGQLVGVINAKFSESDNISYAIKASYLRALAESVDENFELPEDQSISGLTEEEKVKIFSNYVGLIKVK